MRRRSRWGRWAERGVSAAFRALSRRALVRPRGSMRVAGLAAPVAVTFDDHAVPHVRAENDADAFLAMGVCHAIERYFQMDMMRRVLGGRLAETVGERSLGEVALPPLGTKRTTLDADRLMRALDLAGSAARHLARVDAEHRALLDAYVLGVNAGRAVLARKKPPEYRLLGLPLEPWTAYDSILVGKGMALGLSMKWRTAPVFAALAEALKDRPDRLEAMLPDVPGPGGTFVAHTVRTGISQALAFLPFETPAVGSNSFLVGGARSRSGKPILASDPHLELSLPGVWYLASVSGRSYRAVGATMPGLGGVLIGRTPTLAWGVTNGMIDDADVWQEEVEGDRYRLDGAWQDLSVETQEIRRRGKPPVMFRLRRTHRGPLLSDAFPGYSGPPLSIRLVLHEPALEMETFLRLGRARTAEQARVASVGYGAPCQNLLFADVSGDAGYRLMGRVPARPGTAHPALPRDGRTRESDWAGFVPYEEMPALDLPPDGQMVSANHPHVSGDYPHYLSHLYEPCYRAQRIHDLLRGRVDLTREDLRRVQADSLDLAAEPFRRAVLAPHAEAVRRTRPHVARFVDALLAWQGDEAPDARGAALWHLVYNHLAKRVFGTALDATLVESWMSLVNLMDPVLLRAYSDPQSPWASSAVRATLLGEAIEDAAKDLEARGVTSEAPWGTLHRLVLRHPLGSVPLLGKAVNQGPFPMPGGPYAVCSGQYMHDRPADMRVGPSYMHLIDLADPERESGMVTFGGQSGWCGSPHYDDLTPLWRERRFLPMRLETLPEDGETLTLLPG